jgi:hypothetical protein
MYISVKIPIHRHYIIRKAWLRQSDTVELPPEHAFRHQADFAGNRRQL